MENVIGPDVAWMQCLHWYTRRTSRPALARDLPDLQFRSLPEPMHVLLIHPSAATPEQRPHPPVAIPGVPLGQIVNLLDQPYMAIRASLIVEGCTLQLQQDTGPALREPMGHQTLDPFPAGRHRHDCFASNTLSASTSRSRSASKRLSRAFSFSSSRHRWALGTVMPPNFWRQR